jgi:hypothetical protein
MAAPRALNPEQEDEVYRATLRRVPYVELARQYSVDRETIARVVGRFIHELAERTRPELEALRGMLYDELDQVKGAAWESYRDARPGSMARNGALSLVKESITEQAKLMGLEKIQIDHRHVLAARVEAWLNTEIEADWANGNDPG